MKGIVNETFVLVGGELLLLKRRPKERRREGNEDRWRELQEESGKQILRQ